MANDIGQTAAAVVTTLAPFTPFLIEVGKAGGKKLAEVMAEKGGEAAWKKAQALWDKLQTRFHDDPEVQVMATVVAVKPEDEARQTLLAEVLGARLQENPTLAQELFDLLGGQEAVQQVLAERGSWVEDVTQRMKGGGKQIVQASDDSVIKGVQQIKK
ncbi:MAG: hypothetical protein WBW48_16130 [Anaerolineae bacterium]